MPGEYPNKELMEIKERNGDNGPWVAGAIMSLLNPKMVVSPNKNSKDSLKIFQLSRETPAPSGQCRNIMTQISVDTLHRKGAILVVDIVNMLPRKDHIQISVVSVCAILFRLRSGIDHPLNRPG